jgi:HSP20 family protein
MDNNKDLSRTDRAPAVADAREVAPPVDIYESADEIWVVADLPGVQSDSINIHLDPPELRLEARPLPLNGNGQGSIVYSRAFRLNEAIDPNGIVAQLQNGVLHLHLKKSEAAKPRRIAVKAT